MSKSSYSPVNKAGLVSLALVPLLLGGCAADNGESASEGNTTAVRLALDWTSYVGYHSPLVLADDKGYFAEEGLKVDFNLTAGSKDGVLAVGTDQADIGWVDLSTASVSMLAEVPIQAVATVQEKNATGLTVLEGTTLESPADVRGLRIGSTPGGSDSTLIPAFLEANDIDESDVTIVNLPANGKLASLITGDVDAISGQVYYYTAQLKTQGEAPHGLLYSDAGLDVLDHGFIASKAFIDSDPEEITGFLAAYRKALAETMADPEAACDLTVARSEGALTQEGCVAELIEWLDLVFDPESETWASNDPEVWENTVSVLKTYGGAEGDVAVSDMFTNELVEAAN
ncbi:NitT/TauT family transport system substrate-binding protein [Arthrobacter pigmenti]|uniref:Thiamine pyrimidine synthase n=1 Tax=Arthrobacter pigmenti TaxID=271432 RepID=A0A846RRF9_9MICC|nr:ABC transporter substrate-binding protein [Arthrobacter pigmenti]NJC23649.1 NitT/TauT family transport system substrate-binding protein [Arthrobacter pigmenti]